MNDQASESDLEGYREYLTILAEMNMDRRLRSKLDPADVVQQAMIKAVQGFTELKSHEPNVISAWLRKILSNELIDVNRQFRRKRRDVAQEQQIAAQVESSSVSIGGMLAADHTSPSMAAVRNEDLLKMAQVMASLQTEAREILVMKHFKNMSVSEIAEATGKTRPSVAGVLSRSMTKLREEMTVSDSDS